MALETPYSYRPKQTPLHRLNAGIKLLGLLVFSTAAFFLNPVCSALLSAAIAAVSLSAGINPLSLLRGSRPIVILGIFVVLGRTLDFAPSFTIAINAGGFFSGLLFLWGMVLSFCAGSLLFSVTSMAELREAVCAAECAALKPVRALLKNVKNPRLQRLRAGLSYPRLGLALSLMLGFIPRFFAEWEALQSAYRARAGTPGIAETLNLIPIAAGRMIDKAAETAAALESRGALL
ncbi:MAG: energy-coupling factor transporter transmembrane protein EcfT [Spirochaetaceae bacterium]|nr:energy-coupling factor transporter transmembrane protein EcfT [Spirochaetaceae bacterium]